MCKEEGDAKEDVNISERSSLFQMNLDYFLNQLSKKEIA